MIHRKGKAKQPLPKETRRDESREKYVVLCVGGPPPLRMQLELGAAGRFVVIRDLARALRFLAEHRVARVLVDLSVVPGSPRPVPVSARRVSRMEVPDVPDRVLS